MSRFDEGRTSSQLRVSVDTDVPGDRRVVGEHRGDRRPFEPKGAIVCEKLGALPHCQCKTCDECKTRNNAILAPSTRHLAYERSGKIAPTFYRMGLGRVEAPLLHSLDRDRFTVDDSIGPGYDADPIDPAVGSHKSEVSLFKFKIGLYNYLMRYCAPLAAEVWALLSTHFERSTAEIYELLQARRPGLTLLHTVEDVETMFRECLVPLALAVIPSRQSTNERKQEVPSFFKTFVEKNLEGSDDIVVDFAEQTLADLRHARLVRAYRAENRRAISMRNDRETAEIHATFSLKFRDTVFKYLAGLLTSAWDSEVREGDEIKVPIFPLPATIDAMLADLYAGAPDTAVTKFRLSIVDKPALRGKKRILAAREDGELTPTAPRDDGPAGKRSRGDQHKDVSDVAAIISEDEDQLRAPVDYDEEEEEKEL